VKRKEACFAGATQARMPQRQWEDAEVARQPADFIKILPACRTRKFLPGNRQNKITITECIGKTPSLRLQTPFGIRNYILHERV